MKSSGELQPSKLPGVPPCLISLHPNVERSSLEKKVKPGESSLVGPEGPPVIGQQPLHLGDLLLASYNRY